MSSTADYFHNQRWMKEIREAFHVLDRNNSGTVSRQDYISLFELLQKMYPNRGSQVDTLHTVMQRYCDEFGLKENMEFKVDQFLNLAAKMCLEESKKFQAGETTWIEKLVYAVFDVIDDSNSNTVTRSEYTGLMVTVGFGRDAADAAFKLLDKNQSGTIDRKEFAEADVKFWCTLNDTSSIGLFGPKFNPPM